MEIAIFSFVQFCSWLVNHCVCSNCDDWFLWRSCKTVELRVLYYVGVTKMVKDLLRLLHCRFWSLCWCLVSDFFLNKWFSFWLCQLLCVSHIIIIFFRLYFFTWSFLSSSNFFSCSTSFFNSVAPAALRIKVQILMKHFFFFVVLTWRAMIYHLNVLVTPN